MKEQNIISIGYNKDSECDFSIIGVALKALTYEEMKEFRAMIIVAIGQAERMWSDNQAGKQYINKTNEKITHE